MPGHYRLTYSRNLDVDGIIKGCIIPPINSDAGIAQW